MPRVGRGPRCSTSAGSCSLPCSPRCVGEQPTEEALAATGRVVAEVKMRMDEDYWPSVVTTFGRVCFPWFAYRLGRDVQVPARALFPLHGRVCSSELCLEW